MARPTKTADQFREMGAKKNRWQQRFEEELGAAFDALDVLIPWDLSDEWERLPQEEALNREIDYIGKMLAEKVLSGEVSVPSPKLFASWARRFLSRCEMKTPAPQPCDARSEKIAEQRRLLAEHEAERKRHGTFRPLESFRAVQNAERFRAQAGAR